MLAISLTLLCAAAPLDEGMALYRSLEFERAAILFQGVALDAEAPAQERAQAAMWAGLSLGQLGDVEGARKSFALAVVTDPQVAAPADAPPALAAILEEERAAAAARAPAVLPPTLTPPVPAEPPPDVTGPAPTAAPGARTAPTDWPAIGTGAAAGVLVVAAAATGVYGAVQYATSADPTVPARPAFEAYDASVVAGWAAAALGGAAAVAGGVATALFLIE
ncbi:MAG: hypothetical protein HYS27_26050 [Deltaproteobacteria bacterium]|nr:hypothetical protein [Deltaproteobacteria bacterium]